jgi:hypothetical protein
MERYCGVPTITYGPTFFQRLRDQLIMIEDYAYDGADFYGDLDLALPEGAHWGDIGKKLIFHYIYFLAF